MLPILDGAIEGKKVSVYNPDVQPRYPLLALRLKNTSGKPLTQGPVTVFEAGTYSGDSRILDLQPNEERLISYALDQAVEVKTERKATPSPDMHLKLATENLSGRFTLRHTKRYIIKNRAEHDRTMVIEHAIHDGRKLIEPAKGEKTADHYRFTVPVPADKTVIFEVVEEQERYEDVAPTHTAEQPLFGSVLGISVKLVLDKSEEKLVGLKLLKGQAIPQFRVRESRTYAMQNLSDLDRTLTVDHVVRPDWTVIGEKGDPEVRGPEVHRFKLSVPKGKTKAHALVEEKTVERPQPLAEVAESQLRVFLASPTLTAEVRAGLTKVVAASEKLAATRKEVADLETTLNRKNKEQERMRENLKIIPMSSEHYKKFLDRFVTQEDELERLQRQLTELQADFARQQTEYQGLVTTLSKE
jgi:hypothetical protein